tara:strand:+ start:213 stop:1133 length:921 start_codon:yes stop_codon:yes gene_type:complete
MNCADVIAQKIKSGQWENIEDVNIQQFFMPTVTGELIPNPDTRIQVREYVRDIGRVNSIYNKVSQTKDYDKLENLTVVRYPSDAKIPEKIGNGNHTVEVEAMLGMKKARSYIVDFEKDLRGKHSLAMRLGNQLNNHDVDRKSVSDADIKKEFYQLIKEKKEETGGKLSKAEKDEFAKAYPQISTHTLGQWESHHEDVGSRQKPVLTYTPQQLSEIVRNLVSFEEYAGYAICEARTLRAWSDTGISAAFVAMEEKGVKKALIPLYCDSIAMVEKWENGKIKQTITERYAKLSEFYGVTLEFKMIRYE